MMARGFLPYGRQTIDEDDIAAVVEALRGDWLTTGPMVTAFEEAFAERVEARFAVACSSATAGLHLAAMAAGLGAGDTALVPTLTFVATANAPHLCGASIRFADVDPDTGLMAPGALETDQPAPQAVFPVHLAGQTVDMVALSEAARARGVIVIEDASHAIGTTYRDGNTWVPVGACRHSDMAVFSLHPVKTLAAGEGGVVTTNDPALAARLRQLRSHGITREASAFQHGDLAFDASGVSNPWYYELLEPGLNYRLSDIACALALSQLRKLDRFVERRRQLADRYDRRLATLAPTVRPLDRVADSAPGWHLYVVLVDFEALGVERAQVMRRLTEQGIGTQVHYLPVHLQPYYRSLNGPLTLSGAEAYYQRCLALPLFPAMTDDDVDRVADAVAGLMP